MCLKLTDVLTKEELDKLLDAMSYARGRWLNEYEYEDFETYIDFIKDRLPATCLFLQLKQKPFELWFKTPDAITRYIKVTGSQIQWGVEKITKNSRLRY